MLTRPADRNSKRPVSPKARALTALPLAAVLLCAGLSAQAQQTAPATTSDTPAATAPATPAAPAAQSPAGAAPAATDSTAAPAAETAAPATTSAPGAESESAAQATPAVTAPAGTPAETPAETPAADGAAPAPAAGDAQQQPAPAAQAPAAEAQPAGPEAAEAPEAPAEPMPSLFEDPAGAITHILTPPERRADLPHDLSPWGMFMAADIVVKAVMLGLAFASLVTWTVWLAKTLELAGAKARARSVLKVVRSARTLSEAMSRAGAKGGPAALMLRAATQETEMSNNAIAHAGGEGLKERVSSALNRIEAAAGRRIAKGTGVLATIGSTAPFVGLFGTVWGIMNSFIGISESQTTNLAVVAPGIAEALLATAIGLVAAIPAVVIYNVFARSITGYRQMLGDVGAGIERLISRDLDFREMPALRAAAE